MFHHHAAPEGSFRQFCKQRVSASSLLPAVSLVAGLTLAAGVEEAHAAKPQPLKLTNIHFETNETACDMGIQIGFDSEGVTEVTIKDPNKQVIYNVAVTAGMADIGGVTETFLEGVEPPVEGIGCEPDPEGVRPVEDLFADFPAGKYEFEGRAGDAIFKGVATLTHDIPEGPVITEPAAGTVVSADEDLRIEWEAVTSALLGSVDIVGYHIVFARIGKPAAQYDVDVAEDVLSVTVPEQFLEPGAVYEFEVLSTDKGNNQTITEGGAVCTQPVTPGNCVLP